MVESRFPNGKDPFKAFAESLSSINLNPDIMHSVGWQRVKPDIRQLIIANFRTPGSEIIPEDLLTGYFNKRDIAVNMFALKAALTNIEIAQILSNVPKISFTIIGTAVSPYETEWGMVVSRDSSFNHGDYKYLMPRLVESANSDLLQLKLDRIPPYMLPGTENP